MIGKTISHYRIIEELGRGGMGVVYKAEDLNLKRIVALKFLATEFTHNSEAKNRFIREAQTSSSLDHDNLCTIYDIDSTEHGQLFISMAYYEGQTLTNWLAENKPDIQQSLRIIYYLALGLNAAHKKGIVHRDMKPANIIITKEGKVKILDFGIAKLKDQQVITKPNTIMGTLSYMSPEQTKGDKVDGRCDIWALSVILYEMLCGQLPFQGKYDQAIIYNILNTDPVPVSQLNPQVSSQLNDLILKGLRKNVNERITTLEQFLKLLKDCPEFEGLKSLSGTLSLKSPKFVNQKLMFVLSFFLLLTIFIGSFIIFKRGPAKGNMQTIAVLPFINLTGQEKQQYLCDALTDLLIGELALINNLHVISRTSSFQFKGVQNKSIQEIAKILDVRYVVEASLFKTGNRLGTNVQLINAQTDHHIWAKTIDLPIKDIFIIQTQLAQDIANAIQVKLTLKNTDHFATVKETNPQLLQLYLKGNYCWAKRDLANLRNALEYFKKALNIDSTFSLAHTGIAGVYIVLGDHGYAKPQEVFPIALSEVLKAKRFNPELAEVYCLQGYINFIYDRDWPQAEKNFKKALQLNKNYATARHWYALGLSGLGYDELAIKQIYLARSLDPLDPQLNTNIGFILYYARRFKQALKEIREAMKLFPENKSNNGILARTLLYQGKYQEALDLLKFNPLPENIPDLVGIYCKMDSMKKALELYHYYKNLADSSFFQFSSLAKICYFLDQKESFYFWLKKAFEQKDSNLIWILRDPLLDPIRHEDRFREFEKNLKLKSYNGISLL